MYVLFYSVKPFFVSKTYSSLDHLIEVSDCTSSVFPTSTAEPSGTVEATASESVGRTTIYTRSWLSPRGGELEGPQCSRCYCFYRLLEQLAEDGRTGQGRDSRRPQHPHGERLLRHLQHGIVGDENDGPHGGAEAGHSR